MLKAPRHWAPHKDDGMSRLQDDGEMVPRWLYDQVCGLLTELVARVQHQQHALECYSVIVEQLAGEAAGSSLLGPRLVNDALSVEGEQEPTTHPQTKNP